MADDSYILDGIERFLARYVALPSPHAVSAVVLWSAHTHAYRAFPSTPRLALLSPEKGSGKTRTLEVLDLLCRNPQHTANLTPAVLFRAVTELEPTLLIDEADTVFGGHSKTPNSEKAEELRGLINSGHRNGATVLRCSGPNHDLKSFDTFFHVVIDGIGDLPDTLMDRSIIVRMRRRTADEKVEPFRERKASPEGDSLNEQLQEWANFHFESLANREPEMPPGIVDRQADVWEPLLAVADEIGGQWPERARVAASSFVCARDERGESLGVILLRDIQYIFDNSTDTRLSTSALIDQLHRQEESSWSTFKGQGLSARQLASILKSYELSPKQLWIAGKNQRGWDRADFLDAYARYLPESARTLDPTNTTANNLDAATVLADLAPLADLAGTESF